MWSEAGSKYVNSADSLLRAFQTLSSKSVEEIREQVGNHKQGKSIIINENAGTTRKNIHHSQRIRLRNVHRQKQNFMPRNGENKS